MDFSIIERDENYEINFHSKNATIWYDTFVDENMAVIENGSLILDKQYIEHLKIAIEHLQLSYSITKQSDIDIFATIPLPTQV